MKNIFVALVLGFLGLASPPSVGVHWAKQSESTVRIVVDGLTEDMESCLSSGLALRYQFHLQYCERRAMWVDRCGPEFHLQRVLSLDPISEHYRVELDRIGDTLPGDSETFIARTDALQRFREIAELELEPMSRPRAAPELQWQPKKRSYLSVRVVADCKGEYSKFFSRVSSILTLGIVSINYFDTGWVDYKLNE